LPKQGNLGAQGRYRKIFRPISDAIKGGMDIIPVARLDDVISKALVRPPVPIVWEEDTKVPVKQDAAGDEAAGGLTAH
jgi:ATP-dependent Lon protease